jgi:hypothetical protein
MIARRVVTLVVPLLPAIAAVAYYVLHGSPSH